MICTEFKTEDPFKLVMDVSHWEEVQSQNTHFELYKRAFHVYSEVKRVHKFADLCHDASVEEDQKAVELGKLITAS
jgi:galactokinase